MTYSDTDFMDAAKVRAAADRFYPGDGTVIPGTGTAQMVTALMPLTDVQAAEVIRQVTGFSSDIHAVAPWLQESVCYAARRAMKGVSG